MGRKYVEHSVWTETCRGHTIVVKQDIQGYWWAWVDGFPVNVLYGDPNRVRVTSQARKLVYDMEAEDGTQSSE